MLIFDQLNKADRHLRALSWVVAAGVVALLSGLWWVQVVRSRHYVEDQRNQSYRTVRVPAPRGRILDRNGVALAENRPVYNVSLYLDDRGWRDLAKAEYAREAETARANAVAPPRKVSWSDKISAFLGFRKSGAELRRLTVAEKNEIARRSRYAVTSNLVQQLSVALELPLVINEAKFHEHYEQRRALPMPIIPDLNSSQIARFQEQAMHLPGLDMEIQPMRVYPQGTLAAHVLGYLKRSEESSEDELSFYNYRLPDYRGQSAVEYSFDEELRGKAGAKSVLVNNLGYRQSETVWSAVEAGKNVTLTIDAEIQRVAETELGKATAKPVRGAVVVLDCRTGEIIAMASSPVFDPNSWIPRLPQAIFDTYTNKEVAPLLNRAVYTGFPPGSTFKTVIALAALEARVLNPEDVYHSLGYYPLGKGIKDLAPAGDYNFKRAFKKSSNSYFIDYGLRIGPEAIVAMSERLHFSERTHIPLGQDSPGNVPTRERVKRRAWRAGDTANMCIGQGEVLVTPLQMAVSIAAVANGGKVLWPQLVASVQSADAIIDSSARSAVQAHVRDQLPVSGRTLDVVREAMLADTEEPDGTAYVAFHNADLKNFRVGGKTGTAQLERGGHVYDHITWFASYGPSEPRYTVVVMVQSGSGGGTTCGPIAAKIYRALQYRDQQAPATRKNIFANN